MSEIEQASYSLIIDSQGKTVEGMPFSYTMFYVPHQELPVLVEGYYFASDSRDDAFNLITSFFMVNDMAQIERGSEAILPCVIAEGELISQIIRD